MELLALVLGLSPWLLTGLCDNTVNTTPLANLSNAGKDMYVINAMVYQVGILTNKTDKDDINTTGNQESVTFYHTNGTKVDLSKIPEPLLTNVTAQSIVGLAPATKVSETLDKSSTWMRLNHLATLQQPALLVQSDSFGNDKESNDKQILNSDTRTSDGSSDISNVMQKRSLDNFSKTLFRRDLTTKEKTVKIVNGAALIPPEAGVQSIALPPLITLNNNLSQIPLPIPNTSIVHYAKINTLGRMP